MTRVYDNAMLLQKEINDIAASVGCKDIHIMAVTKNQPVERIEEAKRAGFTLFGENRVQEFQSKEEYFSSRNMNVHLIGHLQSNKVKQAVGKFELIQSVDSIRIASLINQEAKRQNIIQKILIEVNIGREQNKYGFLIEEVDYAIHTISEMDSIRIHGLMTIPPITNKEVTRGYFKDMKCLFVDISDKKIDNIYMKFLSMGMTSDYELAIIEGSNMVRLGTAIFAENI